MLSQKNNKEEIKFFTKFELSAYEYFPDPLPDAFIALIGQKITKRYFLDIFDETTPPFVLRKRIRKYREYAEDSSLDENTDYAPFPSILFVCPKETAKRHAYSYAKALLEKTYEDKLHLFLTIKQMIQYATTTENIWQKVEI